MSKKAKQILAKLNDKRVREIYAKANVVMLKSAVEKLDESTRKNLLEGVAV